MIDYAYKFEEELWLVEILLKKFSKYNAKNFAWKFFTVTREI